MRWITAFFTSVSFAAIGVASVAQGAPRELARNAPGSDWPANYTVVGDVLLYAGASAESDVEPWRSDGSMAGTTVLKDLLGPIPSYPNAFARGSSVAYFIVSDELWRSQGTAGSTQSVNRFDRGIVGLAVAGDRAFISTWDDIGPFALWTSDGTQTGTVKLRSGLRGQVPSEFAALGRTVLFAADDGLSGLELWRTDGTPEGTTLLKDIAPGETSSNIMGLTVANGLVFFTARSASTYQLWRSDGTAGGTFAVADLSGGVMPARPGPEFGYLRSVGNSVFFVGRDHLGAEVWKSDGTVAGTLLVKDICEGTCSSDPSQITAADKIAYFTATTDSGGTEVWRSDGTSSGTYQLKDIQPGGGGNRPLHLTAVGKRLYFTVDDRVHGNELWVTDGTQAGTQLASDLTPGSEGTSFQWLAGAPHGLYFATYAPGNYANHLWFEESVAPIELGRLVNVSTRARVLDGDNVLIAGFIIGGNANKTVLIRARGPSLRSAGVADALDNPTMTLYDSDGTQIRANDDWRAAENHLAIDWSGQAPPDPRESGILINLAPGAYTAVVTGVGASAGIALVEVFELGQPEVPLSNISGRALVQSGDNVAIGGFIIQGDGPKTVLIRGRGPSLAAFGIANTLANPHLQLVRADRTVIAMNDDWQQATNRDAIAASGFAPSDGAESALLVTLDPGGYTMILSGVGGISGVGIVEVFAIPGG